MNAASPEWWRRVQAMLDAALDRTETDPAARPAAAADDDPSVRREVERILRGMDRPDDFLAGSAAEFAAGLLDQRPVREGGQPIGTRIARYRIVEELGRGGMAIVYRARDDADGRELAIKIFQSDVGRAIEAKRFLREIELRAVLRHPHILPIVESGASATGPWFAMPVVAGGTLRDRLKRDGRVPPGEAVAIARQVALALAHAHEHGIVHRDIKPANILLGDAAADARAPHALVADFGIAKVLDDAFAEQLTLSGMAMGTLSYMSPEQMRGQRTIDARTDIYALGCVLFEMLAGAPLWSRQACMARLRGHRSPAPVAERLGPLDVPATVQAAIARAVADDPAARFGAAAEMAAALEVTSRAL